MRAFCIVTLILLTGIVVWRGVLPALQTIDTDFPNYYTGAHLLTEHRDLALINDNAWFGAQATALGLAANCAFFSYPPATTFVMLPLVWLPPLRALQVWTIINIVLVLVAIRLLRAITGRNAMWSAIILLASGRALINNFKFGQFYLVLLVLVLVLYRGMQRDQSLGAGIALGVGAAIKYFPALYAIPLIARKQWRILSWGAGTAAGLWIAAWFAVGGEANLDFITRVIPLHLSGSPVQGEYYTSLYESWNSLFRRLFVFDVAANPSPLIPWSGGYSIAMIVMYATVARFTIRAWRAVAPLGSRALPWQFSLITIAALTVAPASSTYHYLLLVPPVALLLSRSELWMSWQWRVLAIYLAISALPYGIFLRFERSGILTMLAYPRLLLMTALFAEVVHACMAQTALAHNGEIRGVSRSHIAQQ